MTDPVLKNAQDDLDALAEKLGAQLHEIDHHVDVKTRCMQILVHYGPQLLEAAIRVSLRLAGVAVIPPLPSPPDLK